jgi:hypothetical protein
MLIIVLIANQSVYLELAALLTGKIIYGLSVLEIFRPCCVIRYISSSGDPITPAFGWGWRMRIQMKNPTLLQLTNLPDKIQT